jgi:peptidoglycan-associated lipoprotein
MRFSIALLLPLISLAACGSDPKPPPQAPAGPTTAPAATAAPQAEANPKPDDVPSKSSINISDEIKKACGITDADAHFAYDSANVRPEDKAILTKLATCFVSGPLKGRQMRLVGHADPRGEAEYNMVLGGKRADNVKVYFASQGLPDRQAETTSRGEMDATGTDEPSWSEDRRVDVILAD